MHVYVYKVYIRAYIRINIRTNACGTYISQILVRICEAPIMLEDFASRVCYYYSNHTAAREVHVHFTLWVCGYHMYKKVWPASVGDIQQKGS